MPAMVALVGAAGSVAAGAAAVGGTVAGFMGATLGTQLIAGAMIGGGVLAGLGTITGNKKLQKWGGILSIAGGVAGLASGAWSASAGAVAEEAARESFRAGELGAQYAADAAGAAAGGIGQAAGGLAQANMGAIDLAATDIGVGAASAGTAPPMIPSVAPAAPAMAGGQSIPQSVNLVNAGGTMQTAAQQPGMLSSITDKFKPAFEWMEKNPRITQAGAGLLTAGLSGYAQAEAVKDQMRLQDEAQARARKRLSDSVQGVTVPVYQRKGG